MNNVDVMSGTTGWIQSASNTVVSFTRPDPLAFDINDIALALSRQPRYGGHGKFFYSVAQHSIYAALVASPEAKLVALMHDAHEAYTGDIPGPLKELLGQRIIRIEARLERAIYEGLGLSADCTAEIEEEVHRIDKSLLSPEYHALFDEHIWKINGVEPANIDVTPWPMDEAQYWFLVYYYSLRSDKPDAVELAENTIRRVNSAHGE